MKTYIILLISITLSLFSRAQCVSIANSDTAQTSTSVFLKSLIQCTQAKSYFWQQVGGVVSKIDNPTAANINVTGLSIGYSQFSLTVVDTLNQIYSDVFQVLVTSSCPTIPNYIVRSYTITTITQQMFNVHADSTVVALKPLTTKIQYP